MKKLRANHRTRLAPVRPSAAIESWYFAKMKRLIVLMDRSLMYWLRAAYRAHPHTTEDASPRPTKALHNKMAKLSKQWQKMFDHMSRKLAPDFVERTQRYQDTSFSHVLRNKGFSVKFQTTSAMRSAMDSRVAENVRLIKSIASEHLDEVEGLVMRSVENGRSMAELTDRLQGILSLDRPDWEDSKVLRRARFIARDQNNKMTSLFHKTRQKELGIKKAIWIHTAASVHPREDHAEFNGQEYPIEEGHDFGDGLGPVIPGEAYNCLSSDTRLDFVYGCNKLFRRWFDGKLTNIITESGEAIKSTGKHPILTLRGWVAAESIHEGDYLITCADQSFDGSETDIERNVTSISQIFDAMSYIAPFSLEDAALFNFHGDIPNSDINVINTASDLSLELDPAFCKKFCEFVFTRADEMIVRRRFDSLGSLDSSLNRLFGTPKCLVSGFSSLLSFLRSVSLGVENPSLTCISDLNACFFEACGYSNSSKSNPIGNTKDAFSGIVGFNNVFDIHSPSCGPDFYLHSMEMTGHCGDRDIKKIGEMLNRLTGFISSPDLAIREILGIASRASLLWLAESPITFYAKGIHADNARAWLEERPIINKVIRVSDVLYSGHVFNLQSDLGWYSAQSQVYHNCGCICNSIIEGFDETEEGKE